MTESKSFVFRFGDVEVREREFSLTKAGEVLAIEPKVFRVLLFLLHNPQKLITKEELLDAVWADAAVTESSLTRSIAKLRKTLGDDFQEPRYISTVTTLGYRLVCPVEVSEETNGADVSEPTDLTTEAVNGTLPLKALQERRERLGRPWMVAATVLALGLASGVWYLRRPLPSLRVVNYTQLTHDVRRKGLWGTDGVSLYMNVYFDPQNVAEVSVNGGEIVRLSIPLKDPWVVDVLPEGSNLLLTSSQNGLWSYQVAGRSLRLLTQADVQSAAWSPDGKQVVYSTSNGDVNVMQGDGTGTRRLANVPYLSDNFLFERLAWSLDGNTIRFDRNARIYEVKADGSGFHEFLPGWRPSSDRCCGQWTVDGNLFLFLSYDAPLSCDYNLPPVSQLWALDERRGLLRRAAEPVQLTSGPIRWARAVPSKDWKRIFAKGVTLSGELVRYDSNSRRLQPYLGGISAEGITFSPDGRFVAYVTYPEGILWRADRDGSNPLQLTGPPLYPSKPHWSPDGTQVLFFEAKKSGESRFFLVSSQGGAPRWLVPEFRGLQRSPDWSPDGRKIAFSSQETTNGDSKYVLRVVDIASQKVTTLPGSDHLIEPRWSPDGRFIAAHSADDLEDELMLFDFETQRWSVLMKGKTNNVNWSRDGQFVYFLLWKDDMGVFRIRRTGGQAERVVDLSGFHVTGLWGEWMGLDPEDAPMLLRDTGSEDIYALTLEEK
jgi:DNA-binding winged helix-turn-helix (wHTH) protein/Tol biopolymer transport system component